MSLMDIKIKDLFTRDIRRKMNGVIKVDQSDEEDVFIELDEYVITKETLKNLNNFFRWYETSMKGPTDEIGVWVSGFFGSGKSHLIKMLGYLLENREVRGKSALEFFEEKIDDQILYNRIERVVKHGSRDVVLFNIEAKADSMVQNELIVNILMRTFNEMQGLFGGVFWLADMERKLMGEGLYEEFKEVFRDLNGRGWESERDGYTFVQDDIIDALEKCGFTSRDAAERMFDADGQSIKFSIEDFSKKIKKYLRSKGDDHQLIFLVDEVGQYIGDNSKQMLNLQSVVEELGKELKGRAWLMVTSQADIDKTLKGMVKKYDFSKIQGRFHTPLALSSANVDEVIKTRLLDKKEEFRETLSSYYTEKRTVLKNLISFSRSGPEMKTYKTEDDFISTYPFVPYQVKLLQKVFDHIRHTGYSGKHLAKGERSLLSAFKESCEKYAEAKLGVLIPFSSFYDTVENFLDPIIRRTIQQTEDNDNLIEEDRELLKILFLIRHVKVTEANLDNLLILSVDHIDQDKKALRERIRESLGRLEKETLIHKSGEKYVFLTNAEQEINKQIKNIEPDEHLIVDEIYKEIYDNICPSSYKGHYLNKMVDSKVGMKKKEDMTIRFLTELSEEYYSSAKQSSLAGDVLTTLDSEDSLLMIFPEDNNAVGEIKDYLRIGRYLKQNISRQNEDEIARIHTDKSREQGRLQRQSKDSIRDAIRGAKVFVDGKQVKLEEKKPGDRIKDGLDKLIENVYRKADYVTMEFENKDAVAKLFRGCDLEKYGVEKSKTNQNALKELLDHISLKKERNRRVVVRDIKRKFGKKPYGWKTMTIRGLLAQLYISEKINFKYQSEHLYKDEERIIRLLTRKSEEDKLVVEYRQRVDEALLRDVKGLLRDVFGKTVIPGKETDLFDLLREVLGNDLDSMEKIREQQEEEDKLPGRSVVGTYREILSELLENDSPNTLFEAAVEAKEDLEGAVRDAQPAESFFNSKQIAIFKRALSKMERFRNNAQFLSDEIKDSIARMEEILSLEEPYSEIKNLPPLEHKVQDALTIALERLKVGVKQEIEEHKEQVRTELQEYDQLSTTFKKAQMDGFKEIERIAREATDCALVESQKSRSEDVRSRAFRNIEGELEHIREKEAEKVGEEGKDETKPVRGTKFITAGEELSYGRVLETEEDLDRYLETVKDRLRKILKDKNIRLS